MFDFGIYIFAYIPMSIMGFIYFYCVVPIHKILSEKYLFILGTYCNIKLGFPNFKRSY